MNIRKHFRTSQSVTDFIITDLTFNRISDKETYFMYCVNKRIKKLNQQYEEKLDKILNFIIVNCNYADLPIESITRIISSLSKVTNTLTKGLMSFLS